MADSPPGLPAVSILKWTGLFQSVDPFAIASGAMEIADNVVIPGPSLLQPRRGFDAPANTGVDYAAIGTFSGFIMAMSAHDTPLGATDGLFWVDVGTGAFAEVTRAASTFFLPPAFLSAYGNGVATQAKSHFFTANGNFYETTNFGLARIEQPKGTWKPAGTDTPVLAISAALTGGTMLPNNFEVAYRFTYRYEDSNGVVHRGPPSSRLLVRNTVGSAQNVVMRALPSSFVLPGTIVELWRTFTIAIPADGSDAAGDEMFKVAEGPIVGNAHVVTGSNGYLAVDSNLFPFFSYTDATPNVPFLVEPLYTNPTTGALNGLGIGNQNTPPPACADAFSFKGRTYFCNTEEVQRLTAQIIGTGTGGIQDGDTFILDGITFTWRNAVVTQPTDVQLYWTGGTFDVGSVIENIRFSAASAALTINGVLGPLSMYLNSTTPLAINQQLRAESAFVNDLPGYLNLQRLFPGLAGFSITAGIGAGRGWAGALTTNNVSDPNRQPANLMQSQPNDPESVPAAFTNSVGQAELAILRGIPLRDYAYLFKAGDDGLWKFSDDGDGNLTIGPLDATVHLIAPETAVSLDNALYCLTDKGVIRVTDGGAPEHISEARIAEELDAIMRRVGPATLARLAFGVAYESDHTYVLCLPEAPNSIACTIQYIYNSQTDAWTRWTLPVLSCGLVAPFAGDVLVFGLRPHGVAGLNIERTLWVERKDLTAMDYQDPPVRGLHVPGAGTYASNTLVFTGRVNIAPGDLIQYILSTDLTHTHLNRVLTADYDISANQTTVTCEQSLTWKAGDSLFILKGIQAHVKLLPLTDGDPLFEKQWQNVYLFFRYSDVDRISVSYSSEKQQIPKSYTLPGPTEKAWLYDETLGFGLAPWGAAANNVILKLALDQAASRSAALTVDLLAADALGRWELSALRIPYDPATMRAVK